MILDEIRNLKTGRRELSKFGLLVGGVSAAIGTLMWVRGKAHFTFLLAPGIGLMMLGLVFPRGLKQVYVAWMSLSLLLGFVVSNVILTGFFFLVITPVGLAARCLGKDFLRLKPDRQAKTFWLPTERRGPKPPEDYERQF